MGSVPSLQEICVRTLQENVDDIAECGGLPYSILKPVLERALPPTLMQVRDRVRQCCLCVESDRNPVSA